MYYPHVGFCCSRTYQKKKLVDLNTAPLPLVQALRNSSSLRSRPQIIAATKQVMAHVLEPHLDHLECNSEGMSKHTGRSGNGNANHNHNEEDDDTKDARFQFSFSCQLYYSLPSYDAKQRKGGCSCVLFINDRLVDWEDYKATSEAQMLAPKNQTEPSRRMSIQEEPQRMLGALANATRTLLPRES
jgi:hypothetical protein